MLPRGLRQCRFSLLLPLNGQKLLHCMQSTCGNMRLNDEGYGINCRAGMSMENVRGGRNSGLKYAHSHESNDHLDGKEEVVGTQE